MKEIRLTNKVTKTFQGNSRGLGLIEVMVALALLGIIAVAFLGGLATASKAIFIADERATAESLARSQMEYVKNQDYIDYSVPGHKVYELITTPAGYEIEPVTVEQLQNGLQKITVKVYHNKPDKPEPVIILVNYKVNR